MSKILFAATIVRLLGRFQMTIPTGNDEFIMAFQPCLQNNFKSSEYNTNNNSISVIADSTMCGILLLDPKKANGANNTTAISLRTILLDPSLLASAKLGLNNNPILQISLKQLLLQANSFLAKNPSSVIEKTQLPASGDKHDYLSLSPYDWPDPTKTNGLPYIYHDGIVNPEAYSIPDRQNLHDMMHRVKILSLAYYFTNNIPYASKAEELL